jgi:hypothetical protein
LRFLRLRCRKRQNRCFGGDPATDSRTSARLAAIEAKPPLGTPNITKREDKAKAPLIAKIRPPTPPASPFPFPDPRKPLETPLKTALQQVARTADFAVRVFSVAIIATVPHSFAVSKLRRPFLSDRYFFIVVRLLRRREKFTEPDFALLARAFNRARALHPFYLTAWVFLPDPAAAGHCICAPVSPVTISLAMK